MKQIWTVLLMLALAQASFGQLSGPLSGTLGPGYYHVVATIYVNAGDSLRIMPGTTLHFEGAFPFYIFGKLTAIGSESDSIVFTSDPAPNSNRWRGLRFDGAGSSVSQLAYCLIENGFATGAEPNNRGGGAYCHESSPTIMHCTFKRNKATDGGGIACYQASPFVANCIFSGDSASADGGGMYCIDHSSPSLTNCIFGANRAGSDGGGTCCAANSSPSITNCIFNGNSAGWGAGIDCRDYCSPMVTHCTIIGNSSSGMSCIYSSSPTIKHCIFWGNTPWQIYTYESSPSVTYSDIEGGYSGTGNIDADPLFVSGPDGPYYLSQIIAGQGVQSPCVDAGDLASPVIEGTTRTDLVQDAWPVDMGYHYQAASPSPMGFVELIQPGPTDWGYRLHWVSGSLSRLVFTNFCSGTIGSVGGNAEAAGWTAANYSDSIVFTTSTPLTTGTIDTFWLSHPYCSDYVTWQAGDSSGTIEGPLPVELTTFQAFAGDGQVTLRWRTESELDNNHFVLYKRKVGEEDFRMLAEIPGHGMTTEPRAYDYVDRWVQNGLTYEYRISDVDITGRETIHEQIVSATPARAAVPLDFALHPNYPNPFNPTTTIRYDVKETGLVSLKVFDLLGREVVTLFDGETSAGSHTVIWDAGGLPSGVFLCQMEADRFVETRKIVLLK